MAKIKLAGKPINTNGELPAVGSKAPDFQLVTKSLKNVGLSEFTGKLKLLSIVPSLDTHVCAVSTRKFNDLAPQYEHTVFVTISADLPFAMERFRKQEGLDNVINLSMMRSRNFARDYGVLLTDGPMAGITARALLVLDKDNYVLFSQLVEDIVNEPDYDAAIALL